MDTELRTVVKKYIRSAGELIKCRQGRFKRSCHTCGDQPYCKRWADHFDKWIELQKVVTDGTT
jgi:hypothetical protein